MSAFIFDLDMTLVDSSTLNTWRALRIWSQVRSNLQHVKPFSIGTPAPHELPARIKAQGHKVAIVTSSPRWYAEELIKRFNIETDVLVAWDDTEQHKPDPEPITKALKDLGADSNDAYHIGDAAIDVEASYHAGVASIGAGWGWNTSNIETLSSAAPDILLLKPDLLLHLDELERCGYFAEMSCNKTTPKAHLGAILPCGDSPFRYALGRYFKKGDPRHANNALARNILAMKKNDKHARVFAKALAAFMRELEWTPDCVVPVPPKPDKPRNRFKAVLEEARLLLPDDIKVIPNGLRCAHEDKTHKSKDLLECTKAIRGTFENPRDWNGAKILLLDDVLTSGTTVDKYTQVLLARNASEVRIVTFGKTHKGFEKKECPECARPMRIRTNSYTGKEFWGCSGYHSYGCGYTEAY